MEICEIEPNTVLLREADISEDIYFIIEGSLGVYRKLNEEEKPANYFLTRTDPGKRMDTQLQEEEEYGKLIVERSIGLSNGERMRIGLECYLLGIGSPYSYITRSKTLAYKMKSEPALKDLL